MKLGSPRGSLTQLIGQELKETEPPWDKIQAQTREYVEQSAAMAKYDPPKGSGESWQKHTGEFAGLAADMDRAAQVRDKGAASAAQDRLSKSCMGCHREHRVMGPGPGGPPPPGGPPGFGGPPPGGPPPPPPGDEKGQ